MTNPPDATRCNGSPARMALDLPDCPVPVAVGRRALVLGGCATLAATSWTTGKAQAQTPVPLRPPRGLPASPSERMAFWLQRPQGFVTGMLGRSPFDADYYQALSATGARLNRVFLRFDWDAGQGRYVLSTQALSALGDAIRHGRALGVAIVLTAEFEMKPNPPLWGSPERARGFADAWRRVARMLRDVPVVVGLDLMNEPNPPHSPTEPTAFRDQWVQLAERTIEAVRAEDPDMPLVIEGVAGGMPIGLRGFPVLADPKLVYSIHFYNPHAITHQHVSPGWSKTLPYPVLDDALLKGTDIYPGPWDAARLRSVLQDAVDFQKRSRAPIYVGEFSCVRWAPGESAQRYVADCLSFFREFGWSWTYHEFRGWPGWDAEIASRDPNDRRRSPDAPVISMLRREMASTYAAANRGG